MKAINIFKAFCVHYILILFYKVLNIQQTIWAQTTLLEKYDVVELSLFNML